ncbi:hypothetical protein J4413_02290 [Candidatus Woesearchaeota archaeon]|nr:hypothetical protein [Candidatus Woesearchaeota archaeon]
MIKSRIKEGTDVLRKEIKNNIVTAVLAAFGFIIALAWKDAIQEAVNKLLEVFNLTGSTYLFRIISALFITIVSVIGIIYVSRFQEKESKENKKVVRRKKK